MPQDALDVVDAAVAAVAALDAESKAQESVADEAQKDAEQSVESSDHDEPEDGEEQSADDAAAEAPKKSKGVQKRIDELTRDKENERREKERLLALVEKLTKGEKHQDAGSDDVPAEPTRDQFETFEEFIEARAEYRAQKAFDAKFQEYEQRNAQKVQKEEGERVVSKWAERAEKFSESHPDFAEKQLPPVTREMYTVILESEEGPAVAYYLSDHPEEAARIARLEPLGQAREIGKIEAKVASQQQKTSVKTTTAPDPIRPVGARANGGDPLSDKLSAKEWRKNFEKSFYEAQN